ncbi:MAG: hypothetical protein H6767_02450 [Candidatus Peribacteria bacterium]|nr:MAG: hypothetical protein H6767_02450 [Candidatus Peribacteria bacterium]
MNSKISKILEDISKKREELYLEYEKLREKYGFHFANGKIVFNSEAKKKNRSFKESILNYLFSSQVRHLLSLPFIYMMIIPTVILDLFLSVYQHICFRLYHIPLVNRSEYITAERKQLDYLNVIQKFHCLYCSYVNGIFSFAVEVGGRTEKYWCPIKHAKKMRGGHDWEKHFADYGDPEGFKECFMSNKEFKK